MLNDILVCPCRDCQIEMDVIQQPKYAGGHITLVTCKNPQCLLKDVTLSFDQYINTPADRLEDYRAINRQNGWVGREAVLTARQMNDADYLARVALASGTHCDINIICEYDRLLCAKADPASTEMVAARLRSIQAIKAATAPEYAERTHGFRFDPAALDDFDSYVARRCHGIRMSVMVVQE